MFRRMYQKTSLIMLSLMTVACASGPVKLSIQATENLNLDEQGGALPVEVRLYQLADKDSFEKLSFNQLWRVNQEEDGENFLSVESLIVNPGMQKGKIKVPRHHEAKYLAVVGIFRQPSEEGWRQIEQLPRRFWMIPIGAKVELENNQIVMSVI